MPSHKLFLNQDMLVDKVINEFNSKNDLAKAHLIYKRIEKYFNKYTILIEPKIEYLRCEIYIDIIIDKEYNFISIYADGDWYEIKYNIKGEVKTTLMNILEKVVENNRRSIELTNALRNCNDFGEY